MRAIREMPKQRRPGGKEGRAERQAVAPWGREEGGIQASTGGKQVYGFSRSIPSLSDARRG